MCEEKNYEAKSNSKETFSDQIEEVKRKFENLAKEAKIKETQGAKRKPLSDGTLELAKEELEEFRAFYNLRERVILDVKCIENSIRVGVKYHDSKYVEDVKTSNIKAILSLAERFDLTEK